MNIFQKSAGYWGRDSSKDLQEYIDQKSNHYTQSPLPTNPDVNHNEYSLTPRANMSNHISYNDADERLFIVGNDNYEGVKDVHRQDPSFYAEENRHSVNVLASPSFSGYGPFISKEKKKQLEASFPGGPGDMSFSSSSSGNQSNNSQKKKKTSLLEKASSFWKIFNCCCGRREADPEKPSNMERKPDEEYGNLTYQRREIIIQPQIDFSNVDHPMKDVEGVGGMEWNPGVVMNGNTISNYHDQSYPFTSGDNFPQGPPFQVNPSLEEKHRNKIRKAHPPTQFITPGNNEENHFAHGINSPTQQIFQPSFGTSHSSDPQTSTLSSGLDNDYDEDMSSGARAGQKFSKKEDMDLLKMVSKYGHKWKKIASEMNTDKSPMQCRERYQVLKPGRKTGRWTEEEDNMVRYYYNMHPKKWTIIAAHIPGRNGKQVRDRWEDTLDPTLRHDAFTPEEDEELLRLFDKYNTKWKKIAAELPGRSGNHVKNRFNASLKKTYERRKAGIIDDPTTISSNYQRSIESPEDGYTENNFSDAYGEVDGFYPNGHVMHDIQEAENEDEYNEAVNGYKFNIQVSGAESVTLGGYMHQNSNISHTSQVPNMDRGSKYSNRDSKYSNESNYKLFKHLDSGDALKLEEGFLRPASNSEKAPHQGSLKLLGNDSRNGSLKENPYVNLGADRT